MSSLSHPYTLIESMAKTIRLPWYFFTSIVAVFLLLPLIIIGIADSEAQPSRWEFWRIGLQAPAIILYVLLLYPFITQMGDKALESAKPLLNTDSHSREILLSGYMIPNRKGEWISISAGIVLILGLSQPWKMVFNWADLYLLLTGVLMFGLLAYLIYYGIRNTRFLTRLNRNLNLDIFNIEALVPIARWSLSITFAFVGGIIISIAFQTIENLMQWQIIMIYGVLAGATVFIFFISMWSTHKTIVKVKTDELTFVIGKFADASRKLKLQSNEESKQPENDLYFEVAAWGLYERQIRDVKEWPFNAGIISRLALTVVSPVAIYLIKILSGIGIGF